jgi:hypothetical protein
MAAITVTAAPDSDQVAGLVLTDQVTDRSNDLHRRERNAAALGLLLIAVGAHITPKKREA